MIGCKSCGAPITWAKHHTTGKLMPLERDKNGEWAIVGGLAWKTNDPKIDLGALDQLYSSHFATCPQAASWRGKK